MRTLRINLIVRVWIAIFIFTCTPVTSIAESRIENLYDLIDVFASNNNMIDEYLSKHGVQLKKEHDFEFYVEYRSEQIMLPDKTVVKFYKQDRIAISKYMFIVDIDERDGCITASDVIDRSSVDFIFNELGADESALRYKLENPEYFYLYLAFYGKQVQCLRGIKLTTFEEFPCGFANALKDNIESNQRVVIPDSISNTVEK